MSMQTVSDYINHHASKSPDKSFLITPAEDGTHKELSYRDLKIQVDQIGQRLTQMGVAAQAKVAFLMGNSQWTTLLFLGVMANRRVIVPINAVAGETQMTHVLNHCDAEVVFVAPEFRETIERLLPAIERSITLIEVDADNGPDWPRSGGADRGGADRGEAGHGANENSDDHLDQLSEPSQQSFIPLSDDSALLLYTSGSTGLPKGAVLSQLAVITGGRNVALGHGLTADDRALCVLPVYHINGAMVTVSAPLVSGGSVVMPGKFSVHDYWHWVADFQCTWSSVVPTIIKYLLDRAEVEPFDFGNESSLEQFRFARSASAPLPAIVLQQWEETFYLPMIETLGLTETAGTVAANPMPPEVRKPGSVGCAVGNEIEIGDSEGNLSGTSTEGELLIRGDNLLTEYYKNPEATSGAFVNGWFRTGDLGVKDSAGYLYITGRLKELIIRGGENIAPREIDDVLYKHEAILEAAAYGCDDENYGQEVYACVALRDGYSCTKEELLELCVASVGKVKAPKKIIFLDELPKGPSGKILRLKLADLIGSG